MSAVVSSRAGLSLQKSSVQRSAARPANPSSFIRRSIVHPQPRFVARSYDNSTSTETTVDAEKVLKDLQEKWDRVENKPQVAVYAVGALVALWLSSTVIGAVNHVPLLPKLLELVGLSYSAWFTYRYLLFKSSRQELIKDVEELKKKITGNVEDL